MHILNRWGNVVKQTSFAVVITLALSVTVPVFAATSTTVSGSGASASFTAYATDACSYSQATFILSNSLTQSKGTSSKNNIAYVYYYVNNWCVNGYGFIQ